MERLPLDPQVLSTWCKWCVPERHLSGPPHAPIRSHGICPACATKLLAEFTADRVRTAVEDPAA
jgi:hypothetical protein